MSIAWMTRVFASPEPRQATERLMLLALADNANDQGVCWPSMQRLRRKCAIKTVRGARKVVARLEADGFVTREEQSGKVTRYHMLSTRLSTGGETPERTDRGSAADPGTVEPGNHQRTIIKKGSRQTRAREAMWITPVMAYLPSTDAGMLLLPLR